MDLLDFEPGTMYFDEPLDPRAQALLAEAALAYGEPTAEAKLLAAEAIAPEHLSVLVALYRYYFYRHQHGAALEVAERTMVMVARRLNFPSTWVEITPEDIARASAGQAELVRFYLHALKGAGYLHLRLGNHGRGLERLDHLTALDPKDRIGAKVLADVARHALQDDAA